MRMKCSAECERDRSSRMRTSRATRRALIAFTELCACELRCDQVKQMDLARKNFSTFVYGNGGGRGPATCVYTIIVSWPDGCAISAECAARRGNFEIAKQAELIPQHKKVIFKKHLYHIDQHIRIGLQ